MLGGGIGVVALLLIAGVLAITLNSGRPSATPEPTASSPADIATAHLNEAATSLGLTPGARLRGAFTDKTGQRLTLDTRASNEGSVSGTLTGSQGDVQVLAVDGRTFLKANRTFWIAHGAPLNQLDAYSKQWVKIGTETLGVDLSAYLAPQVMAAQLAPGVFFDPDDVADGLPSATPAGTSTVDGTPVEIVDSSAGYRVYLTTGQPRRVVRIIAQPAAAAASPTLTRTEALRADPAFDLNLSDLSAQEMEQFYADLQRRITELKSSVDAQVQVSVNGSITLAPCGPNACQANVTLSNQVRSNSPYLSVNQPVRLSVTIAMTLDGRPVRTCVNTVTMAPNGSGSTSCFAAYVLPPERNPTTHHIQAEATAYGLAYVDADLKRLADDVAAETRRNRQLPTPSPTTPPTAGGSPQSTAGSSSPKTYGCKEPTIGSADGGPGAWTTVNRGGNYKPDAPWRSYQEQVTGFKINNEYRVPRPGDTPVDFEGFTNENGNAVYTEAKGIGYAGRLSGARVENGNVIVETAAAQAELDRRMGQLRRQLQVVAATPGARLRFVAAEQDALNKIKAYAQKNLGSRFDLIDWEQQDKDWKFKGCP